jgi:uncharacterized DUF497 family protein
VYLHKYVYIASMQFSWDEAKRQANLCKHGLDFVDASSVFEGATFTFEDDRFDNGEQRYITLGLLRGRVVIIAHTEHHNEIRMISMREGIKREQMLYFRRFTGECRTP